MKLIAQTLSGLEPGLKEELEALGAAKIEATGGGFFFDGDKRMLYRSNLELRTALKILYPIANFRARTDQHLYDGIAQIDWNRYLNAGASLAVDADCVSEFFPKNGSAALRCRDAIGDRFEKRYGERPTIDTRMPDLRIHLSIREDFCQVSLDSSGQPLNDRGYDHQVLENSLNAVMAAGMLLLSGWNGKSDFIDPMCGSGTLLIEAAMLAWNIPPLMHREYFGFKKWPNYDAALWEEVKKSAAARSRTEAGGGIFGYDSAFQALRASERNIVSAKLTETISVERLSLEKQKALSGSGIVMMCPPPAETYSEEQLKQLYRQLGEVSRKKWADSAVYLLMGSEELLKQSGLDGIEVAVLGKGSESMHLVKLN